MPSGGSLRWPGWIPPDGEATGRRRFGLFNEGRYEDVRSVRGRKVRSLVGTSRKKILFLSM